jgi:adenosine deaminase
MLTQLSTLPQVQNSHLSSLKFSKLQRFEIPEPVKAETYTNPNRIPNDIYAMIQESPKVVFHDHLRGSTDASIIRYKFLEQNDTDKELTIPLGDNKERTVNIDLEKFSWEDWDTLKKEFQYKVEPGKEFSLYEYRIYYDKLSRVIGKKNASIYMASYLYGLKAAGQGVRYAEVRQTLSLDAPANTMKAMARGLEDARRKLKRDGKKFDYGLIVSINRHGDQTLVDGPNGQKVMGKVLLAMEHAQAAVDMRKAGYPIVGFDLASDEANNPLTAFQPAFDIIHKHNKAMVDAGTPELRIGITIHSGETPGSEGPGPNIKDGKPVNESYTGAETIEKAIEVGWREYTPLRIGHGLELVNAKPEVIEEIRTKGIAIELNPKCNNQTRQIYYNQHPVNEFIRQGISISINPDNQTVSNTSPVNEMVKLLKAGIDHQQRQFIALRAIESAFIFDEAKKAKIKADIIKQYEKIDTKVGSLLAQKREQQYIDALRQQAAPSFEKTQKPPPPNVDDIKEAVVMAGKNATTYYLKKWAGK